MNEKQAEYLRRLSKTSTPLFPFDVIESKIKILLMERDILNKHPEDFPKDFRETLQKEGVEMGENLSFYTVQEIQDFYRQAYNLFKENVTFPETAKVIQDFRGKVIAHIKTESSSEIAEECIGIEGKYGFDKIYTDWKDFKDELYTAFKEGKLKLPKQNGK